MIRARLPVLVVTILFISHSYTFAQTNSARSVGNNNQVVGKVNGPVIQNNIKVTKKTKIILQQAAKGNFHDERGWLSLLIPADDEFTADGCTQFNDKPSHSVYLQKKRLFIEFGTNVTECLEETCVVVAGNRGPGRPLSEAYPLVSVRRVKAGLLLSARIFDRDGKIVARIVENSARIYINGASDYNLQRNEHTLWVKDNYDRTVLYVRFLNPDAVHIEGIFNLPLEFRNSTDRHREITITKDNLTDSVGGSVMDHSCAEVVGTNSAFGFSDYP